MAYKKTYGGYIMNLPPNWQPLSFAKYDLHEALIEEGKIFPMGLNTNLEATLYIIGAVLGEDTYDVRHLRNVLQKRMIKGKRVPECLLIAASFLYAKNKLDSEASLSAKLRYSFRKPSLLAKMCLIFADLKLLSTTLRLVRQDPCENVTEEYVTHQLRLLQSLFINSTPLSHLSHKLWCKHLPTYDIYVDNNWVKIWRPNHRNNPALYVLEAHYYRIDDPLIQFGPWRNICKKYFQRSPP